MGRWSTSSSGRFTPGKEPVHIALVNGSAPEPVGMGSEKLAQVAFRYSDHPGRTKSP